VDEPAFEENLTQYVVFGDIAVMQLTFNHIELLYKANPALAGFLQPELMESSRLIMPFVSPGSYASEFLRPGSIVKRVNGHEVFTLDDFKKHFVPDAAKNKNIGPNVDVNELDMEEDDGLDDSEVDDEDTGSSANLTSISGQDSKSVGGWKGHQGQPAFLAQKRLSDPNGTVETGATEAGAANETSDPNGTVETGATEAGAANETSDPNGTVETGATEAGAANETSDVVWTLETDDGEVYAVFFDESLQKQVATADSDESSYLLPDIVLKAATERNALPKSQSPFLRALLGAKPAQLQLDASRVHRSVEPLPTSIHADIPLKWTGSESGWPQRLLGQNAKAD